MRFQLNETLNVEALGRYLESIDAHLTDMYYNPTTGEQQVQYSSTFALLCCAMPRSRICYRVPQCGFLASSDEL